MAMPGSFARMFFSKSFGYALRGILYLAVEGQKGRVQLAEVATRLKVPRHFLAKVMKKLAKEGVLQSQKGPSGGFSAGEEMLKTPLFKIAAITGESSHFDSCVLRLRKCNSLQPCPLHHEAQKIRNQWISLLSTTTIGDLLKDDQADFIKSIATF